jgi:hypothetical protein
MTQTYLRLRPDIMPLQWHEAVAVVQVVARQLLASGEQGPVPAAADLALDPNGVVHIVSFPHAQSTSGDGPAGLAALLRALLQFSTSPPTALASLADDTEGTSARFRSVEDFSRALQFFERPLSQNDLAAHAARLATTQEQRRLNAELEQLTQKARDAEVQPQQTKNDSSPSRRASNRRKGAIAVLLVGFPIAAIFAGAQVGWNKIETGSMREAGTRLVERVRSEAKAILGNDASAAPSQPSAMVKRPPPHSRRRSSIRPEIPAPAPVLPAVDLPLVTVPDTNAPLGLAAGGVTLRAAVERGPEDAGTPVFYSRADREVEPPVIMRPQIRSDPAGRSRLSQLATLVLDIDEQGEVSQVRLASVSAEERYYAGMMVAAAKAWRFRPAQKEGKPVRYRLRLRVSQ